MASAEGLQLAHAPDTSSGYKGVKLHRDKRHRSRPYEARTTINGRTVSLGRYTSAPEAALAYARAKANPASVVIPPPAERAPAATSTSAVPAIASAEDSGAAPAAPALAHAMEIDHTHAASRADLGPVAAAMPIPSGMLPVAAAMVAAATGSAPPTPADAAARRAMDDEAPAHDGVLMVAAAAVAAPDCPGETTPPMALPAAPTVAPAAIAASATTAEQVAHLAHAAVAAAEAAVAIATAAQ